MIVVAAGIVERDGKIMLCQRKPDGQQPLKWEFPGGKLEAGESPEQALERELWEELAVRTRTGKVYDTVRRTEDGRDLLILFYRSELREGEPRAVDCNAIAWARPDALTGYDLAPADALVAGRISREAREHQP